MEILIVDGMSEDSTREIVEKFVKEYAFIRLLDNPQRIVSCGLNIGIKNAKGEIIMRMDAHNRYAPNYVFKCVKHLQNAEANNVGGLWITLPAEDSDSAKAIAYALSSPFGVGNVYFRIGSKESRFVDTVPFGCYKKEVFEKIGLFEEELVRCQDDEFNYRLRERGGKILLRPEIVSFYYARPSLRKLWKQYFQYGFWKVRVLQKHPKMMMLRHFVPPTFVLGLIVTLTLGIIKSEFIYLFGLIVVCYICSSLFFSFQIAKKRGWKYLLFLPLTFSVLHLSYGLGFVVGLVRFAHKWL